MKIKKKVKKIFKKIFSREILVKVVVIFSTLALIATSILPFLIR